MPPTASRVESGSGSVGLIGVVAAAGVAVANHGLRARPSRVAAAAPDDLLGQTDPSGHEPGSTCSAELQVRRSTARNPGQPCRFIQVSDLMRRFDLTRHRLTRPGYRILVANYTADGTLVIVWAGPGTGDVIYDAPPGANGSTSQVVAQAPCHLCRPMPGVVDRDESLPRHLPVTKRTGELRHYRDPARLTHPTAQPYHLPAPNGSSCGMALPVAPT